MQLMKMVLNGILHNFTITIPCSIEVCYSKYLYWVIVDTVYEHIEVFWFVFSLCFLPQQQKQSEELHMSESFRGSWFRILIFKCSSFINVTNVAN